MDAQLNHIFSPTSYNDLFSTWSRYPDAVPYAGGTSIIAWQEQNIIQLPRTVLDLDKIDELKRITRTEQYMEIGAMVRLNQLTRLGKLVPPIIYKCLEKIAGAQLRNIATIGGNICENSCLYDFPVILTALDAQYELRSANSSRWAAAARFHARDLEHSLKKHEILTRIRLPLIQWDYSIYKKFLSKDNYNSEVLVFLAKAKKTLLTDLRIVYKSNIILRNRNSEELLLGKNLPINRKITSEFVENWEKFLNERPELSEFSKNALLNNIRENVFILSE